MFIIIVIIIQIFFFIIFPLIASGKVEAGKLFKWLLYIITLVTLGIMIFPIISQSTDFETSDDSIADGFEISSYTVKLDVDKKQKVAVEEDITINWEESGHHGIYKFTPEWLKYTSKEGKTIRRKSTITNLRAEVPEQHSNNITSTTDPNQENNYFFRNWSEQYNYESTYKYSVDEVKKKKRIKIGSPDVTLWTGEKDYIIKYDYDMGSDPYEGYDEFIFHAYGDFWGTDINNPTIEITMPKSIENNNIHFFMDKKRKYDVTNSVDYTVSGNKLIAKFNIEKYKKNKKENNPYYALETALTVDIELPDNYFENGSFNYGYKSLSCIIICLIIMVISFLLWLFFGKDYEKKAKVVGYMPPRDLSAAEIGYIDANGYSKKLVISLVVELAAKKMLNIRETKSGNILIKGFKPNKEEKDYEKKLKAYEKKVDKLNSYEKKVLNELVKDDKEIYLKDHSTFYQIFGEIEKKLDKNYKWKINEKVSYVLKYLSLFLVNIAAILMFVSYRIIEDLPLKIYNLYYVGFISVFITLFFSIFMTRKSRYGEDLNVEISGFKEFLKLVEKDKLEELVEKMPDYFYQILPYTYVLNLSRKWIKKFEDIKMPDINVKKLDVSIFDSITDQVYVPAPKSSGFSSGSSGCSSCGGGCSSCGGGCSSCGGGGSW